MVPGKLIRFVIYGLLGICFEVTWGGVVRAAYGEDPTWSLRGHSYLWMIPIYGLISPCYEPIHNRIRNWLFIFRWAIYGVGIMVAEFITGWLLLKLTGHCPWDYSSWSRYHIMGLVRLDFFPIWATLGLVVEPLHDFLVRLTPAIQHELRNKKRLDSKSKI